MLNTPVFKHPLPLPNISVYRGKELSHEQVRELSARICDDSYIYRWIAPTSYTDNTITVHEPSCKCAYCGCTNDHIYGTCDYCGAPLEG